MKYLKVLSVSLGLIFLVSCSKEAPNKETAISTVESEISQKNTSEKQEEPELSTLDVFNEFSKYSETVKDLHYTKKIEVGHDKDVKPGIYDLEIVGGKGNITVERKNLIPLFVNWIGSAVSTEETYPSKFRIILANDDKLDLNGISKINLIAAPTESKLETELSNGEFIIGRDIKPGKYKIKTNVALDGELSPEWNVDVLDIKTNDLNSQVYKKGNEDIIVELNEGNVITTFFSNYDNNINSDEARLILEEIN